MKDNRFLIWLSLNGTNFIRVTITLLLIGILGVSMYRLGAERTQPIEQKQEPTIALPAEYKGEFTISHYCSCPVCTSTPKGSRTATGHIPREGRTVAVDKKLIPLHSVIYVEGLGTFVAEDVGGAVKGKHLDIYISDHQRALNLGTLGGKKLKVYILQ